jgi:hypothetical protein
MRFHSRDNRLKGDRRNRVARPGEAISYFGEMWMLSRALSLATVTLLIGCLAAGSALAQATNLEAGKSPSQIFAGTCNACHKSPRGLLKTVPASSLPGYLRQHYTTSSGMASVLSSYLVSNGASDTRYQAKQDQAKQDQAKQGNKDAKQEAKQDAKQDAKPAPQPDQLDRSGRRQRPTSTQETERPDADAPTQQGEGGRQGRNGKRLARPVDPDAPPSDGQAATDSKPGAKQKLSKRGRGGEELPKSDPSKPDSVKDEAAKTESAKDEAAKPEGSETAKTGSAREGAKEDATKLEAPNAGSGGEPTLSRPDPVPPVTPAPAAKVGDTSEPAGAPAAAAPSAAPTVPSVTAVSTPPLPPAAPAGPPAPPISQ